MAAKYQWLCERLKETIQEHINQGIDRLPTEEDLCRKYGLSRQTVRLSLSLLEQDGLIAKRQGSGSYLTGLSPNPSQNLIGILLPDTREYLYPELQFDIQRELMVNGFSTETYETGYSIRQERSILESFLQKQFRGLIVAGSRSALPNPNSDLYRKLDELGCHLLFLQSPYSELTGYPCLIDDNRYGSELLVQHLTRRGHTDIGVIFQMDDFRGSERFRGFLEAMRELKLPVPDEHIGWFHTKDLIRLEKERDTRFLQNIAEEILSSCTAVICQNDEIAYYLIKLLQKKGYQIPKDLAVASFDNSYLSNSDIITITSLSHTPHEMGTRAAHSMLQLLKGLPVESQTVPWKLMHKNST